MGRQTFHLDVGDPRKGVEEGPWSKRREGSLWKRFARNYSAGPLLDGPWQMVRLVKATVLWIGEGLLHCHVLARSQGTNQSR